MILTRRHKSVLNITTGLTAQIVLMILSFFTSRIIKQNLGLEYLGLNGIFASIIAFLSLTEFGIGEAVTFSLYEPLAKNNYMKILAIMAFFKKAYRLVSLGIVIIGCSLIPFIPRIVNSSLPRSYIILVYIIFICNSSISYLLMYKQNILIADQKNYIISLITTVSNFFIKISQIVILVFTQNYILFLSVTVLYTIVKNIVISKKADKVFPYLKSTTKALLDKESNAVIHGKIKALFLHSVGSFIYHGTDTLLLGVFFGAAYVGKYVSYTYVIVAVSTLFTVGLSSIQSNVGNYLLEKKPSEQYSLFSIFNFLNSYVSIVFSICFALLLQDFITLWLGKDALLNMSVLFALVISNYFRLNRALPYVFKAASGLFEPDRFASVLESFINIFVSIILAIFIGPIGIVIGTIVSTLCVPGWVQPYLIYKNLFNVSFIKYVYTYVVDFVFFILLFLLMYNLSFTKYVTNNFFEFMLKALVIIVFSMVATAGYFLTKRRFRYYIVYKVRY